jgi:hypothetical protein
VNISSTQKLQAPSLYSRKAAAKAVIRRMIIHIRAAGMGDAVDLLV